MRGQVLEYEAKRIKNEGRKEGRAEGRIEGIDESRVDSIRNLMETLKLSAKQAMEALKIPLDDQARYSSML